MHTDDTDTLTRARASGVHRPSQHGSSRRDGLEAGDTAAGRRAPRSRCLPGRGDVQVPQSPLRASRAWWPAAWRRLGLTSASCGAPRAGFSSARSSAPPPPQAPGAPLFQKPAASHRLGYIWDALPPNCQPHYCDQVNIANLYIYCLGK